jgi:Family of unknown function (DUF6152)
VGRLNIAGTGSKLLGLAALSLLWGGPQLASAHHSLAGEFNTGKSLVLNGVVSRVDWANPHIYLYLDVIEAGGKSATWQLECVPVAMARKAGVSKKMLTAEGAHVTVDAFPARDGTAHLGYMAKIIYADGHDFQFAPDSTAAAAK